MSQTGYGYPPPDGHNIHQGFAHTAQSTHGPTSHSVIGISHSQLPAQDNTHRPSYGQNIIPGLGLGQSNNAPTRQDSWSSSHVASWPTETQPQQTSQPFMHALPKGNPATQIPGLNAPLEDGEISEDGELEDVYEPMETQQETIGKEQSEYQLNDVRERSGSYSPYLSPQEISQPTDELSDHPKATSNNHDTQPATQYPLTSAKDNTVELNPTSSSPTTMQVSSLATSSRRPSLSQGDLEATKKQAKDAILRLWPLNIRFQNYISEGVDEALLKSLFKDLGLKFGETMPLSSEHGGKEPATSVTINGGKSPSVETRVLPKRRAAPVDPSEEKITEEPLAQSTKTALTQSEKSKLLQQKMEALKKAREALRQQTSVQLSENNDSTKSDSTAGASKVTVHDETSVPGTETLANAIPGLSWSPSKQLTDISGISHQPKTALKDTERKHTRLAPPFDQNTESRPFLIDVSEDEDEEMEIDSPGAPETPPNMLSTPGQRDGLFGDLSALSDSAMLRQVRSPASISTPLRSASRNNGSDLESMNKQIEEMKRKIAEAEARKKAKNSRQGSPAPSHPNDSSLEDSSDANSQPVASIAPSAQFYGRLGHGVKAASGSRFDRRSRSRAASERLPLLEARRREQLLKLKALQSEVARIEQELEEDMLEEERLKEQIMSSNSDREDDESAPVTQHDSGLHQGRGESTSESSRSTNAEGQPIGETIGQDQHVAQVDVAEAVSLPLASTVVNAASEGVESNDSIEGEADLADSKDSKDSKDTSSDKESLSGDMYPTDSHVSSSHVDGSQDIDMEDAGYSADEDAGEDSEGDYEPSGAVSSAVASNNGAQDDGSATMLDAQQFSTSEPVPSDATLVKAADVDKTESSLVGVRPDSGGPKSSFLPYKTPLHYFHAYRFHPSFKQDVAGGLRSVTYSNRIDVKKEVCPDELAGQPCPRGSGCEFQHFETMQAPAPRLEVGTDSPNWTDDQILLQLGAAEHYDGDQRQQYIDGLRQLLTDYRDRQVKDFNTISQGIVEFRAKFLRDKTKILPLGSVSL
ncbi:Zinc finger domain-containing protein, CCCH-type [Pochonia chlamydosporia 170]|uniref:Zinc finger domain-containing protein, CCCH-type n=1 Tax=Pochonia chlamydosporia 170 TaxID=1380566 RepID=A0A179FPD7_METCM|nr:Zinc finger domain-containing protein, CCCH-type [Pochonia chlamydosporia 170]OAQ67100.2 Zinc finger domain-containing protein, CCCH-type [Pochonia chlamydosporia 170]